MLKATKAKLEAAIAMRLRILIIMPPRIELSSQAAPAARLGEGLLHGRELFIAALHNETAK
ncbi:hypothetical protein [Sphingobium ummariense]|uniref:hypothetical protein n=1 Tax=Sphingobium ummariense TaxID=420994 RepID=UPI001392413C|nr:hypothetical protein [Sphingobium ummariense]